MSKTAHTPKPWRLGSTGRTVLGAIGQRIALLPLYDEQTPANARLIVAAPDLLDALELMLSSPTYGNEPSDEAVEAARAAIAKAKGSTSSPVTP